MSKLISVICACYNGEHFIYESLQSIAEQSYTKYEIILVDDHSSDSSLKKIQLFCRNYPNLNIKVLQTKYNVGCFMCRTIALHESSGEYIAIQDADDISFPNRLQLEHDILSIHSEFCVVGSYAYKIDSKGKHIGKMFYPPQDTLSAIQKIDKHKLSPIIDPSSMYRKSTILNFGGYDLSEEYNTCADFDLWCRLLLAGEKIYNMKIPLVKYRVHNGGVTTKRKTEMRNQTDHVHNAFVKRQLRNVEFPTSLYIEGLYEKISI